MVITIFFFLWWPGFEPRTLYIYDALSLPVELSSRGHGDNDLILYSFAQRVISNKIN